MADPWIQQTLEPCLQYNIKDGLLCFVRVKSLKYFSLCSSNILHIKQVEILRECFIFAWIEQQGSLLANTSLNFQIY